MLDLNYVRENLDRVRAALARRGALPPALDDFAKTDAERRRIIGESDQLNAERNTASREIGELMKSGKKAEADTRRKEVGELKERIAELDRLRDESEARMHELLSTLPNIPHESVPTGRPKPITSKCAAGARNPSLSLSRKTMLIWEQRSAFSILNGRQRSPEHGLRS